MSLYEPYKNFQKNFENKPKNSTYFIKNYSQLEEEYYTEILGGFRDINEFDINNYSEQNNDLLNDNNYESFAKYFKKPENEAWNYIEPHNFFIKNTEEINKEMEINIKNNNKIRFDLFNIFDNSNRSFSSTDDYYSLENIISINNNFSNTNSFSINSNKEEKKEGTLIGKKRRIFNIIRPKAFIIFKKGGNDNNIRQLIKDSLKENVFPKKSKQRKGRKDSNDNIRKKIKARFLKALKDKVNKLLSLVGSKKIFDYLQHEFVSNINKKINRGVLELTFKELYSKNFCKDKINGNSSLQKYKDNQSVLKYLEEEKEISKKSKYDIFKDMKYYEIFKEYLRSEEFEKDIYKLKNESSDKYIKTYIRLAFDFINFFYYEV